MIASEVVVVGASAAGLAAAEAARTAGHDGRITVVGREPEPPYTRPALSKALLHGRSTAEALPLPLPRDDIELRLGVEAIGLNRGTGEVLLAGGESLHYDKLVIASGARADTFRPGGQGENVLRSLADAIALRSAIGTVGSVLIVGGGFVGLELASASVSAGVRTTVLSRDGRLVGGLGPELSALFTRAAEARGVAVRRATGEVRLEGDPVGAVSTCDGGRFEADLVVTAIGCRPNTEWLRGSGVPLGDGVLVDERCRVDATISAAGDVAQLSGRARTPFWTAALEQAAVAGTVLLRGDDAAPYTSSEFVWTEAFGITANILGPLPARGEVEVLAGDPAEGSVLLRWRTGTRCTAAAVNHRISRRKLRDVIAGTSPAPES